MHDMQSTHTHLSNLVMQFPGSISEAHQARVIALRYQQQRLGGVSSCFAASGRGKHGAHVAIGAAQCAGTHSDSTRAPPCLGPFAGANTGIRYDTLYGAATPPAIVEHTSAMPEGRS